MDNTEGVLRRAILFDALDDDGARTLRRQMAEVKLSRGEHLFMEGDDGDALYVVIDGKMKLTRAAADGRENLLSVVGPGEMFGELSLFDPRPRTSSGTPSVTDSTWPGTRSPICSNQNLVRPVSTAPLSGIGVGWITS